MYKAKFITAYLQREILVDAVVVGGDPLVVGEALTIQGSGDGPVLISGVTANSVPAAAAAATHILAQSDMTVEYGHVPVENRDYRYSPEVAASIAGADPLPNFDGFFESAQALNAALGNGTKDHTALVKAGQGYTKYSSNGTAYTNANVPATVKKVAVFKITNKDDVVIYDAEA